MSRKPFDSQEQRIFLRTLVVASFAGCVLFAIIALVRGDALIVPALGMASCLMAIGVVFGWFGAADEENGGEK